MEPFAAAAAAVADLAGQDVETFAGVLEEEPVGGRRLEEQAGAALETAAQVAEEP